MWRGAEVQLSHLSEKIQSISETARASCCGTSPSYPACEGGSGYGIFLLIWSGGWPITPSMSEAVNAGFNFPDIFEFIRQ